ncbi:hypothetical protein [Streptomyces sp. CC228A]|uniref:hypothetical protein n=1 Tax=Streptomyces sp. CC228A TaxID=2898186 RepID=UPI0027E510B3|nr:hypothetical protein [Streptomyces sp. CC228A]
MRHAAGRAAGTGGHPLGDGVRRPQALVGPLAGRAAEALREPFRPADRLRRGRRVGHGRGVRYGYGVRNGLRFECGREARHRRAHHAAGARHERPRPRRDQGPAGPARCRRGDRRRPRGPHGRGRRARRAADRGGGREWARGGAAATAPAAGTKTSDGTAAEGKTAEEAERESGDEKAPAAAKPPAAPADTPADPVARAIKDAADQAGAEVRELPDDVKGLDPKQDEEIPDGAKPRFPCPTPDPQALADADLEPGLPHLPDDPWKLESTLLTLRGLKYHGIVEVKTGSGTVKKALKFTASEVDIKDLHQITVHSAGRKAHVESRPGSTSTLRNGTVTMYTEELKGNLFGIIPITFSPESPPPLDVPFAFFTDARVVQAGQFGGTLTVPGLHNHIEG